MKVQLALDTAVVVTGGSAGIGPAIAQAFARLGCRIAVLARDGRSPWM